MDSPPMTSRSKGRVSPLPSFSSAIEEKHHLTLRPSTLFTSFYIPLPNRKRIVVPLPIPPGVWFWVSTKLGRRKASALVWVIMAFMAWLALGLLKSAIHHRPRWSDAIIGEPPTLVFGREDLRRIWNWEVASGHYPSTRSIPPEIRMAIQPYNPGLPPAQQDLPHHKPLIPESPSTIGTGSKRRYINLQISHPNSTFPKRVPQGAAADLDVIMDNCDFSKGKYVRDCLEVMRLGAGLDVNRHLRRGDTTPWNYIYLEEPSSSRSPAPGRLLLSAKQQKLLADGSSDSGLWKRDILEKPLTSLPKPKAARPSGDFETGECDPDYPKIFHMFWAGPFNEKPYVALLSYLFTQNLGLHLDKPDPKVCRPQFWMWINPGPAAAVPNPNALGDMFAELAESPWAAPFLHPRFKDVIRFKMWNTTEQLDSVPELKEEWRSYQESLFNSGGIKYKSPKDKKKDGKDREAKAAEDLSRTATSSVPYISASRTVSQGSEDDEMIDNAHPNITASEAGLGHGTSSSAAPQSTDKAAEDDLFNRLGSDSATTYDRLSVVLSDMVRFILTHRFGGTYLDADTVFLRDWEELWGWKGAFAYRWSRLPTYNTAVLRLNKGSALGTFLLRTAFRNGFDFHPMTIGKYTKDAYLEGLLLRLPDAMFDPAWLAQEGYQRDRPPFPMFTDFKHFFLPPPSEAAAPNMLGFDGFFKGAYSYHFHNFWWVPFDAARNFPDLGPKFKDGELKQRARVRDDAFLEALKAPKTAAQHGKKSTKKIPTPKVMPKPAMKGAKLRQPTPEELLEFAEEDRDVLLDSRDLGWSAVLKRTFEAYIRGERPNMYGEYLVW